VTTLPAASCFGRVGNIELFVINKKDYTELENGKRQLATLDRMERTRLIDAAFGVLKGGLGKRSSAEYVSKMRKRYE
jgi:hypothetical protein